jgi:hypothetical protein
MLRDELVTRPRHEALEAVGLWNRRQHRVAEDADANEPAELGVGLRVNVSQGARLEHAAAHVRRQERRLHRLVHREQLLGDSFSATRPTTSALAPSTSAEVEVTFRPRSQGPKSARLIIVSNAANAPEVLVSLVGDSLPPVGGGTAGGGSAGGSAGGASGGSAGGASGGSAGECQVVRQVALPSVCQRFRIAALLEELGGASHFATR